MVTKNRKTWQKNAITMSLHKIILIIVFTTISFGSSFGQSTVLQQYIKKALAHDPAIVQQNYLAKKAYLATTEAKTLQLPTVNFNSTYSTAVGGRSINFPVGDLINPIYSTLNFLTPAQFPKFPENAVPNINEQLVPKNFYDVRIKTQMPLINTDIKHNKNIKNSILNLQNTELPILQHNKVKEIKLAYFNYLKTHTAQKIYQSAAGMLFEIERINKMLIANNMASPIVLLRTQNEQAKIQAEHDQNKLNTQNAQYYFNYLLGVDYQSKITIDSSFLKAAVAIINTETLYPEIKKLQAGLDLQQAILAQQKSFRKPKIGALLDVGSQGSLANITAKNPFALLGVSIDLPLYTAGRNQLKIQQQEQDILLARNQQAHVLAQLELQAAIAQNNFDASIKALPAKASQVATTNRIYTELNKKHSQGQANIIELLEVHNQLTNNLLQQSIAIIDTWIKHSEWERALAAYQITQP
jgi:outer membrane protein TolC